VAKKQLRPKRIVTALNYLGNWLKIVLEVIGLYLMGGRLAPFGIPATFSPSFLSPFFVPLRKVISPMLLV
jgi:hypothetical protein